MDIISWGPIHLKVTVGEYLPEDNMFDDVENRTYNLKDDFELLSSVLEHLKKKFNLKNEDVKSYKTDDGEITIKQILDKDGNLVKDNEKSLQEAAAKGKVTQWVFNMHVNALADIQPTDQQITKYLHFT